MNLIADLTEAWPMLAAIIPVIGTTWASYKKLDLIERWLLHHTHDEETGEVVIPSSALGSGTQRR